MVSEPRERDSRREPWVLVRFVTVGIGSTLAYLGVSFLLLHFAVAAASATNVIALGVGLSVSYLGHYYFTYRRPGRHVRFGSRFIAVTTFMFLASTAFTYAAVDYFGVSAYVNTVLIAGLYPLCSFVLHHFWTFLPE